MYLYVCIYVWVRHFVGLVLHINRYLNMKHNVSTSYLRNFRSILDLWEGILITVVMIIHDHEVPQITLCLHMSSTDLDDVTFKLIRQLRIS